MQLVCFFFLIASLWMRSLRLPLSLEEIFCSDFSKHFLTCQNKSRWAWWVFFICVLGTCQAVFYGQRCWACQQKQSWEIQAPLQITYLHRCLFPFCSVGEPAVSPVEMTAVTTVALGPLTTDPSSCLLEEVMGAAGGDPLAASPLQESSCHAVVVISVPLLVQWTLLLCPFHHRHTLGLLQPWGATTGNGGASQTGEPLPLCPHGGKVLSEDLHGVWVTNGLLLVRSP